MDDRRVISIGEHLRPRLRSFGEETLKLLPSFLLITIAGGLFTQCYQHGSTRAQLRAQEAQLDRAAATEVLKEASSFASRRLYLEQRASLWVLDSTQPFILPEQVSEERRWYEASPMLRASMCRYFGPSDVAGFQGLMLRFAYVGMLRSLERDLRSGRFTQDSLVADFIEVKGGPDSLRGRMLDTLDALSADLYLLNLRLVDRIRNGQLATANSPACADTAYSEFERFSSKINRYRFFDQPRDTLVAATSR